MGCQHLTREFSWSGWTGKDAEITLDSLETTERERRLQVCHLLCLWNSCLLPYTSLIFEPHSNRLNPHWLSWFMKVPAAGLTNRNSQSLTHALHEAWGFAIVVSIGYLHIHCNSLLVPRWCLDVVSVSGSRKCCLHIWLLVHHQGWGWWPCWRVYMHTLEQEWVWMELVGLDCQLSGTSLRSWSLWRKKKPGMSLSAYHSEFLESALLVLKTTWLAGPKRQSLWQWWQTAQNVRKTVKQVTPEGLNLWALAISPVPIWNHTPEVNKPCMPATEKYEWHWNLADGCHEVSLGVISLVTSRSVRSIPYKL